MKRLITVLVSLAICGLATAHAQAGCCCCRCKLKLCCTQYNAFSPFCCQPCLGKCCCHQYVLDCGTLPCCGNCGPAACCCGPSASVCGDASCLGSLPGAPVGTAPSPMPSTTAPPPASGVPSYTPPPPAPLDNMGNPISYYPMPMGYPMNYGMVQPAAYMPQYPAYMPQYPAAMYGSGYWPTAHPWAYGGWYPGMR